jgi:hypothetical protein
MDDVGAGVGRARSPSSIEHPAVEREAAANHSWFRQIGRL